MRSSAGTLCALAAALWAYGAGGCPVFAVDADDAVRERWPDLSERITSRFAERQGVDRCARVKLDLDAGGLVVEVRLVDGRSASRKVPREQDVLPTLEALLALPHPAPPEPTRDVRPMSPLTPWTGVAAEPAPADRLTAPRADGLGFELSVVTSGRVGDEQTSVSLGVLTLIDVSGWLVGAQGRVSEYSADAPTTLATSWATIELGVLTGPRWHFEALTLDLVAGPAVAVEGGSSREDVVPAGATPPEAGQSLVPRLNFAAHAGFFPRSMLRGFVGVEGELGATGQESDPHTYPLPVWMVGLALGATVGSR